MPGNCFNAYLGLTVDIFSFIKVLSNLFIRQAYLYTLYSELYFVER